MTMMMSNLIPKESDLLPILKANQQEAEGAKDLVQDFKVKADNDLKTAVTFVAMIKKKYKEINQNRRDIIDPINKAIDKINDLFGPTLDALSEAEIIVKGKVSSCVADRHFKRDQLLHQTEEENIETALAKAEEILPPKIKGLSIRENWQGKIEDKNEVIKWIVEQGELDLLKIDESGLKQKTKRLDRDPKIPGWKAFKKLTVVISPDKVL